MAKTYHVENEWQGAGVVPTPCVECGHVNSLASEGCDCCGDPDNLHACPCAVDHYGHSQHTWRMDFYAGRHKMQHLALEATAQFCPVCHADCGAPDFEPDDESVGIFGIFWYAECPTHGGFTTNDLSKQALAGAD
jgi:hypothetical protein